MFQRAHEKMMALKTIVRGTLAYVRSTPKILQKDALHIIRRAKRKAFSTPSKKLSSAIRKRHVRVWIDGKKSFRRIRRLIDQAKRSIIIRIFIWKNDSTGRKIRDALLQSADRGVQISITKEASGDFFEAHTAFLDTQRSHDFRWQKFWQHRNISVDYRGIRDHSKVYVFDHEIVLLTGMNIAEEYEYHWHDYVIELHGESFVSDLVKRSAPKKKRKDVQIIMNTEGSMHIRSHLTSMINDAKRSIVIEHCYFHDPSITKALAQKSKEGVRITVIIPKHADIGHHRNMETVKQLLRQGDKRNIRVLLYPTMFHGKLIIVDRFSAFVGSANVNPLSLDRTGEVCVELRGRTPALRKLRRAIRRHIRKSRLIRTQHSTLKNWLLASIGL